jgi:DnaD/phage-associated family protein
MFAGFTDSEIFTQLPDSFFQELLPAIEDADELKATLYVMWRIEHMEGRFRSLCRSEIVEDAAFLAGIGEAGLDSGLEKAVQRGSLLRVQNAEGGFYFLNSPRGRAAAQAMQAGDWRGAARQGLAAPPVEKPNVFKLYEENVGPLTPMIADALKDAEQTYSEAWVAEALEIAVTRNKRSWRYIEAILKRWKEEGHAEKQDRGDAQEGGRRYSEGEFTEYLKRD